MEIVIHTGMYKTGSTSIRTVLRNLNLQFPGRYPPIFLDQSNFNSRNLKNFSPDWIKRIVSDALEAGWSRIFISGQIISSLQHHQIIQLVEAFNGHDVRTITCLRHWAGFLPSRWRQNVKQCDTQSLGAYLSRIEALENDHIEARFDLIIDHFQGAGVTQQQLISYDHANANGDLVKVVLNTMSHVDFGDIDTVNYETRANISSDSAFTDILRLFNGLRSIANDAPANMLFDAINLGTPVECNYRQSLLVEAILQADNDLHQQLLAIIAEATRTVTLSSATPAFRRWEALLNERALENCVNAVDGRFFPRIPERVVAYADLEVDDLPANLRRSMNDALRRALRGGATA